MQVQVDKFKLLIDINNVFRILNVPHFVSRRPFPFAGSIRIMNTYLHPMIVNKNDKFVSASHDCQQEWQILADYRIHRSSNLGHTA